MALRELKTHKAGPLGYDHGIKDAENKKKLQASGGKLKVKS